VNAINVIGLIVLVSAMAGSQIFGRRFLAQTLTTKLLIAGVFSALMIGWIVFAHVENP